MRLLILSCVLALATVSTAWFRRRPRRVEPFRSTFRPFQYLVRMRVTPTYLESTRVWNDQSPERQVVPLRHRGPCSRDLAYTIDLHGYATRPTPDHSALRTLLGLIEVHFHTVPTSLVINLRYDSLEWTAQARISKM